MVDSHSRAQTNSYSGHILKKLMLRFGVSLQILHLCILKQLVEHKVFL
nr:MAG TPA_asm: hypothetical protein [Caudoviricetes sp.]